MFFLLYFIYSLGYVHIRDNIKGDLFMLFFYTIRSQVSLECVCEIPAQNTPQIIYYTMLYMPISFILKSYQFKLLVF